LRKLLTGAVLLAALATSAQAFGGVVPPGQQQQIKLLLAQFDAGDLAYVPSHAPKHYVVGDTAAGPNSLGLTLVDASYVDSAHSGNHAIVYAAAFNRTVAQCRKGNRKTMRVQGKSIYWNGGDVEWRCVLTPSGRLVKLSAASTAIGRGELALVIASAARIR
jgi:hypothetical protein